MKPVKCAVLLLIILLCLAGCAGESNVDVGKHAIIRLSNDSIVEGEIQSMTRWSASLTEVTIDGVTYYVHPLFVTVIAKEELQ